MHDMKLVGRGGNDVNNIGELFKEFIEENGFDIVTVPDSQTTISSVSVLSRIVVAMFTGVMLRYFDSWNVFAETSSNNNLIEVLLKQKAGKIECVRYNTNRAN